MKKVLSKLLVLSMMFSSSLSMTTYGITLQGENEVPIIAHQQLETTEVIPNKGDKEQQPVTTPGNISITLLEKTMVTTSPHITVTIDQLQSATELNQFKNMGVNFEMSKTSDEMWNSNGKWMEQTYAASGIKMIRWGYDAWVFDWENELPLNTNYQGGMNTKDYAGSFGLREFLKFAKNNNITPFLHLPIESWNHKNGKGDPTYARVLQLAENMATYLNNNGFDTVYFDMGNEPMYSPSCPYGTFSAQTYGSTFKDFYTAIKGVNPNYKIVMMANNRNWYNSVKSYASEGETLYFDAIDYHDYPSNNVGWDLYYKRNDDDIFRSFGEIDAGIEKIMGECNIPWPNFPTYSTSLGSGLALLNGFLDLAQKDEYSSIIMWPSQWASDETTYNSFNPSGKSFGWFNQDAWQSSKETKRHNGPIIAEMIAQKATLPYKVELTSTDPKVRAFAFTNEDKSMLNVIAINKLKEDTSLTFNIPEEYTYVKASVFKGEKNSSGSANQDLNPDFLGHISQVALTEGVLTDNIQYGECAIVYTFYKDEAIDIPGAFDIQSPSFSSTEVSTAHNFKWQPATNAENYRIIISTNEDLSNPTIDTTTSGNTNFQPRKDLEFSTRYYWKIIALNKIGETEATSGVNSFTTIGQRHFYDDHDGSITYTGKWQHQKYLGAFGKYDHGTSSPGATATIAFNGTRCKIYGIKDDWIRKISVSIDGNTPEIIDLYRDRGIMAYRRDDPAHYNRGWGETELQKMARLDGVHATQELIYDTGEISGDNSNHTITITVLNEYNPNITKSWKGFELDYYEVIKAGETALQTSAIEPVIVTDLPQNMNLELGQTLTLSANATVEGQGVLEYEWYKDGKLLNEMSDVLTIPEVTQEDKGEYRVKVTHIYNQTSTRTIDSKSCLVNVTDPNAGVMPNPLLNYEVNRTFNGTSDYIDITEDLNQVAHLTETSIAIRFKTSSAGVGALFSASNQNEHSSEFAMAQANGNIMCHARENAEVLAVYSSPRAYNDSKWHTAIMTAGPSGSRLYVDGEEVGRGNRGVSFASIQGLNSMNIGRNMDDKVSGEWYFNGQIDTVKIYDELLTIEQIKGNK